MRFVLFALLLLFAAFTLFVTIARRGRELRKNQPLPPPAEKAFLRWDQQGHSTDREISTPFYLGSDPQCQVVLAASQAAYEACIFHHQNRFAIQTLPGGGPIFVNGEEKMAGYLWDGDQIRIAKENFKFFCY